MRHIYILPVAIGLAAVAHLHPAHAHGVSVLFNPYVHEGEAAAEFKGAYNIDADDTSEDEWAGEMTAGYGVTSWWHTEVGAEFVGHEDDDTEFNALVWENKFQLAPKDAWPVDVGIKTEYAKSIVGGPDAIIGKVLLAKDVGQFTNVSNIGIAREIGEDSGDDNEYSFGYGLSYNIDDALAIGGEWHSDFGTLEDDSDAFDEQSHRIGPVVYGEIAEGVLFETGVLIGVSEAAPAAELKLALEYEF